MESFGPLQHLDSDQLHDTGIISVHGVQVAHTHIIQINTTTASKANAINLGAALAAHASHSIGISIDADVYPEKNAIAVLFKHAYAHIGRENDKTVLLNTTFANKVDKQPASVELPNPRGVVGRFFAFNVPWIRSIGGVPNVINEDLPLTWIAKQQGQEIVPVPDAISVGARPRTLRDKIQVHARGIKGRLQVIHAYPTNQYMLNEALRPAYMKKFPMRLRLLASAIIHNPRSISDRLFQFAIAEIAWIAARRDMRRDPTNPSWEPAPSTKIPRGQLPK
jgi:cellulose synthase/poly-beta-1,6-N-acetylglucosamine synthase-like glycosyltransferase